MVEKYHSYFHLNQTNRVQLPPACDSYPWYMKQLHCWIIHWTWQAGTEVTPCVTVLLHSEPHTLSSWSGFEKIAQVPSRDGEYLTSWTGGCSTASTSENKNNCSKGWNNQAEYPCPIQMLYLVFELWVEMFMLLTNFFAFIINNAKINTSETFLSFIAVWMFYIFQIMLRFTKLWLSRVITGLQNSQENTFFKFSNF